MTKTTQPRSTFDELMEDDDFRQEFEAGYQEFLLSELIHAIMAGDTLSVRQLAKEVGMSPTAIQNLRSGKAQDIKLSNFMAIVGTYGYQLVLEKDGERISLAN